MLIYRQELNLFVLKINRLVMYIDNFLRFGFFKKLMNKKPEYFPVFYSSIKTN